MPYTSIMEWESDWDTHKRIDAAIGDAPAEGLLMHASGPCEIGTRVVDIWESKRHQTRFFNERIVPALASLGIEPGPPASVTEFDVEIVRT
jgi:hypothetical protein